MTPRPSRRPHHRLGPRRTTHAPTPRVEAEETTRASAWSSVHLQAAILKLLAVAPLMKWEMGERLRLNEARIGRELDTLKKAKFVKVVGRRLDRRKWALITWQGAVASTAPKPKIVPLKPLPPTSWWLDCAPEAFTAQARAEQARRYAGAKP